MHPKAAFSWSGASGAQRRVVVAAALGNAGFRSIGVLWQHLDNRILLAVR